MKPVLMFPFVTTRSSVPLVEPSEDRSTALARLRQLRGVTWEWRTSAGQIGPRRRWMGVLAQDVQAAFPDAVVRGRLGTLKVDYNGLIGALVESVKELADRVEQLEKRDHLSDGATGR